MLLNNADVRAWATSGYRWKIATQPETQITHIRGGRQRTRPQSSLIISIRRGRLERAL